MNNSLNNMELYTCTSIYVYVFADYYHEQCRLPLCVEVRREWEKFLRHIPIPPSPISPSHPPSLHPFTRPIIGGKVRIVKRFLLAAHDTLFPRGRAWRPVGGARVREGTLGMRRRRDFKERVVIHMLRVTISHGDLELGKF